MAALSQEVAKKIKKKKTGKNKSGDKSMRASSMSTPMSSLKLGLSADEQVIHEFSVAEYAGSVGINYDTVSMPIMEFEYESAAEVEKHGLSGSKLEDSQSSSSSSRPSNSSGYHSSHSHSHSRSYDKPASKPNAIKDDTDVEMSDKDALQSKQGKDAKEKEAIKTETDKESDKKSSKDMTQLMQKMEEANAKIKALQILQEEQQQISDRLQLQIEALIKMISDRQKQIQEQSKFIDDLIKQKKTLMNSGDDAIVGMEIDSRANVDADDVREPLEKLFSLQSELTALQGNLLTMLNSRVNTEQQELKIFKDVIGGFGKTISQRQAHTFKLENDNMRLNTLVAYNSGNFLPGFKNSVAKGKKRTGGVEDYEVDSAKSARTQSHSNSNGV